MSRTRSGKVSLSLVDGGTPEVNLEESRHPRISSFSDLLQHARVLSRSGYFPLAFRNLGPVEGNHFGALRVSDDDSFEKTSSLIRDLQRQNVWICDAAALPKVPNGPITASIMVHSRGMVLKALADDKSP